MSGKSLFSVFKRSVFVCAETAQSALGSDVKDAVITVPFEFGEMQKSALRYGTSRCSMLYLCR